MPNAFTNKEIATKAGKKSRRGEAELTYLAKAIYLKALHGSLNEVESAMQEIRDSDPYKYMMVVAKMGDKLLPTQLDVTSDGKGFEMLTDEKITDGLSKIIARLSD